MCLAGDAELVVLSFPEGPDREELVATGDAAVGGHAEEPFEGCREAGDVLGGNALELVVAADGAVRGKAVGEWSRPATKAGCTTGASPGQAADKGGGEIHEGTLARPTAGRRMAGGTNHQRCSFE